MRASRSGRFLTLTTLALALAVVPGAQAQRPAAGDRVTDIRITPKRPTVTSEITVSFTAGKIRRDERYDVQLEAPGPGTDFCTAGYAMRVKGVRRAGRRVSITFSPGGSRAFPEGRRPGLARFCAGDAVVSISRANAENTLTLAGSRRVTLAKDRGYPPDPLGVPVKITVLEGSALSVKATGRPDRSMPVSGILRGIIPGRFKPNTDVQVEALTGSLLLPALRIDPLCAGSGPLVAELALTPGGPSNLLLKGSGEGTLTLALAVDRLSLAGCAAPATPVPTTLVLSAKVNADGLLKFPISGGVTGIPIADGVTADATANLILNVDLSGKG